MGVLTQKFRTQKASDIVNLDTYTLEDHLIVSKAEGDNKIYIGRAYQASPLISSGSEFANVVLNVFKSVPDDSLIQVSLVCAPDHDAAERFGRGKDQGSEVVSELVRRQQGLLRDAAKIGWKDDLPILNRRSVLITLSVPVSSVGEAVLESARQLHAEFLQNIKTCGFFDAKVLSASEVVGVYRQFVNIFEPRQEVELDELVDIKYQVYGPDQTLDFRDPRVGVMNGKVYTAGVTCKAFPAKVSHGLMNLASGAPFNSGAALDGGGQRIATPYILTTCVRVARQRKEWDRIDRAIESRQQKHKLPFKLGKEDPETKLADLMALRKQCSEDGNKFVYVSTCAFVYGENRDQVIRAASGLKGALDKLKFDARDVLNNVAVRWVQTLPLNFSARLANELAGEAVMAASAAGCLLPVYGDYLGNAPPDAKVTGAPFVTRRGSAYFFDPFVSNSNYNGVVAASPGSGKSFALQYLVECGLASGDFICLFDNGRSAKKLCTAVGGEFNEFGAKTGFRPSLNPYTGLTDDEFDEQQEMITSLFLLMAYENERPESGARIALNEAVKAAWGQRQSEADIPTVIGALEQTYRAGIENTIKSEVVIAAGNLIPRLRAFIESPTRGEYFRGKGTLNPKNRFTVFELGGLGDDEHLKKCVLFFLMNMLITRLRNIRGRKVVWVDESHDFLKDPLAGNVLEGLYLKGRKDAVGVWVVVQSLLKLLETAAGPVIINQSPWKLILGQESGEVKKVLAQKLLSTFDEDPFFERLLTSVETRKGQFSEIMMVGPRAYEVVRLYVDRFTATLFSSEGDARDAVFDLMERGLSATEAVSKILGEKKSKRGRWMKDFFAELRSVHGLTTEEIVQEVKETLS